jgi:hypothetical protein
VIAAGLTPAPPVTAMLLVDTGASNTHLDDQIIARLGLQPTGSISVLTPTTGKIPVAVSTYDIDLIIQGFSLPGMVGLPHVVHNHSVSGCDLSAQGIDGLLGRDVLALARMTYSGPDNHFFLSF